MRAKRVVIWLAFILLLAILLLGGLWYGRLRTAGKKMSDPSYGLITSPLNDDVLFAGDAVYVEANFLLSHRNLAALQLYVDGANYVLDQQARLYANRTAPKCSSDDADFCGSINTRSLWIPTDAGAHILSACISGDESQGPAWTVCTDKVTVSVANLESPPETSGTYLPRPGDTIESVAYKFGLPPLLVAASNPGIDPVAELPGGIPVNIPADPSLIGPPQGSNVPDSPRRPDKATMAIDPAVDKAYCYYSLGDNYWSRLPAGSQAFAYPSNGLLNLTAEFRSLTVPPGGGSLALECWGWSGVNLISLGSGQSDVSSNATDIQVRGQRFVLDLTLMPSPGTMEPRGIKYVVPPPQGLTATNNLDVCVKHIPSENFILTLFCKSAIENSDTLLVWDWAAPIFPPDVPSTTWLTKIDGYHVYMVLPGEKPKLIKTIPDARQKILDLPYLKKMIFVGTPAFFVRAYVGPLESANSNLYTLSGTTSGLETITLPLVYGSSGGALKYKTYSLSLCTAGTGSSINIGGSQVVVGFDGAVLPLGPDSCLKWLWEYQRAQFGFDLSAVRGPVSSARLSYRQDFTSNPGQSCARELRVVTTTKSGVDLKDVASDPYAMLPSYGYAGAVFNVDVTDAVRNWMLGTPNAGFLFVGRNESLPRDDFCGGFGESGCIESRSSCWTRYGDIKLIVTYFK